MAITFEVRAKTGEGKDGKALYSRIGVVMETKNGPMLKIEIVPVRWDGWAYLSEPKAAHGKAQPQGDDEVPW